MGWWYQANIKVSLDKQEDDWVFPDFPDWWGRATSLLMQAPIDELEIKEVKLAFRGGCFIEISAASEDIDPSDSLFEWMSDLAMRLPKIIWAEAIVSSFGEKTTIYLGRDKTEPKRKTEHAVFEEEEEEDGN